MYFNGGDYVGIDRMIFPQTLLYLQALPVACVGLFVNILSGLILGGLFSSGGKNYYN
jgi:Co/Zn/Cd efflux system component